MNHYLKRITAAVAAAVVSWAVFPPQAASPRTITKARSRDKVRFMLRFSFFCFSVPEKALRIPGSPEMQSFAIQEIKKQDNITKKVRR